MSLFVQPPALLFPLANIEQIHFRYGDYGEVEIPVTVNGTTVYALLDTGAMTTNVRESEADILGLSGGYRGYVKGINGTSTALFNTTFNVHIPGSRRDFTMPYAEDMGTWNVPEPMLLGLSFFRDNGLDLAINFQQQTLEVWSDSYNIWGGLYK